MIRRNPWQIAWKGLALLAAAWLGVEKAWCDSSDRVRQRPNIVWLTSEDNGPHLGCYGDSYAVTPRLDALASRGLIFARCWSNAPVCAPARTTIIAGMYATSLGAEHMRSFVPMPRGVLMAPQYLRKVGYYCTNNRKEDYNLEKPGQVWDESSGKAHWKNAPEGAPFFAVFNSTVSHESQIRKKGHQLVHDPSKVRVPAYHPDTPIVRHDWAQYYDKITEMDAQLGKRLDELAAAGHMEDTIIFYYGDHGSGMPRSKRWPYNSGLQVPLIVYIPKKFAHLRPNDYRAGGVSERLVAFVDLFPTVLSLAGIRPPEHMQGRAFLGPYAAPPKKYLFGYRGRMDERYDMVRSVTDGRFVYIRNYMPHKIYGQYLDYMFQTPTTQQWHDLYHAGKLRPPQTFFWEPKPSEELYDLNADPDEVHNLASDAQYADKKAELRRALRDWILEVRDTGFLPEAELHRRRGNDSPYDMAHEDARYPLRQILEAAELASMRGTGDEQRLVRLLSASDPAVRYWGVIGFAVRGREATQRHFSELRRLLDDPNPSVQIAAAELVGQYGNAEDLQRAMDVLLEYGNLEKHRLFEALAALNAVDALGERARPFRKSIAALPARKKGLPRRLSNYVPRLLDHIADRWNESSHDSLP